MDLDFIKIIDQTIAESFELYLKRIIDETLANFLNFDFHCTNPLVLVGNIKNVSDDDKIFDFLDKRLLLIRRGLYYPTITNLKYDLSLKDIQLSQIQKIVEGWMKNKDLPFKNVKEMESHFGNLPDQEVLNRFLDSKIDEIKKGIYFPDTQTISRDLLPIIKNDKISKMVGKWMKRTNLPFQNITDMKRFFSKIPQIPIQERIFKFLDSKINEINSMEYIPTSEQVIQDSGIIEITPPNITQWFNSRYKYKKIIFSSLSELKEQAGLIISHELYEFLDSKRNKILNKEFIPSTPNVLKEKPEFKVLENLTQLISGWLTKNNLPHIKKLKKMAGEITYYEKLNRILHPLKEEIKNNKFIPTVNNIMEISPYEFKDMNYLNMLIGKWLNQNKLSKNITEYLRSANILPYTVRLTGFLDSKLPLIKDGLYFPTMRNLRKDTKQLGFNVDEMQTLSSKRAIWYRENIGKTMSQHIDEFDPTYDQLGYDIQKNGYPFTFRSQKLRVTNALFQTVRVLDKNNLTIFIPRITYSSLETFLKKIEKQKWYFIDIITGEIFTLQDYYNGLIVLHHINFIKVDLRPDNLAYISSSTHALITNAEQHFVSLFEFFKKLIINNIGFLKIGKIPESWKEKSNWRNLAIKKGVRLLGNSYRKRRYRPLVFDEFKKGSTGIIKWTN